LPVDEDIKQEDLPYEALFWPIQTTSTPKKLNRRSISEFFYHSLALSAWKKAGNEMWSLRVNPSSGNLHPSEAYVLLPSESLDSNQAPGLFHYQPYHHALDLRSEISSQAWAELTKDLPRGSFFVGLTSIAWRESWKYGERAFRYCQHDCGHAIAALRFSAALAGWRLHLLNTTTIMRSPVSSETNDRTKDTLLERLLGLDRDSDFHPEEDEDADVLALIVTSSSGEDSDPLPPSFSLSSSAIEKISKGRWYGKANRLSQSGHRDWPSITEVSHCTKAVISITEEEKDLSSPDPLTNFHPSFVKPSQPVENPLRLPPINYNVKAKQIIRLEISISFIFIFIFSLSHFFFHWVELQYQTL
jgi:SagB-type dehydrogenase family enzyme